MGKDPLKLNHLVPSIFNLDVRHMAFKNQINVM